MHIGEQIKARAKEIGVGPTVLARRIRTSKQNVYGIYRRSSIDTELLQKLSKALEFDFFQLYLSPATTNLSNDPQHYTYGKGKTKIAASKDEELARLKKELADLREKYELLRELYETKTGKKVPGSV